MTDTTTIPATAAGRGLYSCPECHLLTSENTEPAEPHCPRCGMHLAFRKPNSLTRSWAYLIAAYALYLPANLLPIMVTRSLFEVQRDTIMSGVVYLWTSGSWGIASVVFTASIAVPLLKMLSLTFLLVDLQWGGLSDPMPRIKLYRVLEFIGRWSMLDVFVVAILVALVQAQSLASIQPAPGILAFAAVVVLSMLATMAFDPRLIWDKYSNLSARGTRP